MTNRTPLPNLEKSGESDRHPCPPVFVEDIDSLQVFEDHDTRGDVRYPPVKQPRVVPRETRPDPRQQKS